MTKRRPVRLASDTRRVVRHVKRKNEEAAMERRKNLQEIAYNASRMSSYVQ